MHWTLGSPIGEVVLFYSSDSPEPTPALVAGVTTDGSGAQTVDLIVLGADIDVLMGHDDAGDPIYDDRATARAVRVPRGQPGKDSGSFWAPRA